MFLLRQNVLKVIGFLMSLRQNVRIVASRLLAGRKNREWIAKMECNILAAKRWMAGTDTFVSEELEKGKSCISYGTRFNAVDSIVNVKERIPLKELEGDYSLDVKSDTEAELILFGQRGIIRTPETKSLQKYTLVTGKSYDIVQPGWRPIIKTKVEGIFYKPIL